MRNLCLSVLFVLLTTACPRQNAPLQETPSADASLDPETLPALRPGTTVLLTRESAHTPHVMDAAVVGTRLVALVRVSTEPLPFDEVSNTEDFLFTSDDEGRSWTTHPLEPRLNLVALLPAASGLLAIGMTSVGYPVYRLDPQSFRATQVARLSAWPSYLAGGVAAGTSVGSSSVRLSRFDAATEAVTETEVPLPGPCRPRLASADGESFEGVCYLIDRRCWVTVRAGQTTAQSTCLGYREWPLPASATQAPVALDGHVWLAYEEEGHVRARRVESGAFGATRDLGPGKLDDETLQRYFQYRPSFGPLLPLIDAAAFTHRRLLEVGSGSAPREVVVAASPCLDDADCPDLLADASGPDARLRRLLPLGGERYLAFYVLVQPPSDPMLPWVRRWHLLARPATHGEVAAPEFVTEGLISGQGNVLEHVPAATPLEQTCARAIACFPGIVGMSDCLSRFARVEGGDPGADVTLARFLATPTGDCSAFRTTYPQLALARENPTGCIGPWAVSSDGTCFDCEAAGLACTVDGSRASCGSRDGATCGCDAQGRAVLCDSTGVLSLTDCAARGQRCETVASGAVCASGECAGASAGWCSADLAVQCQEDVPVSRTDCSRLGLPCEQSSNPEQPDEQRAECRARLQARTCDAGLTFDGCSGPYVVYCIGQQRRFIDCPALGLAACSQESHDQRYFAWCSP